MTTRNLDALFRPASVTLIGASNRAHSLGAVIAENLREGGFEGPILPVNPKHSAVAGILCYPDVKSLPLAPDLAIICTPPQTVPPLIAELGARGTRAAIVVTAGFQEGGSAAGLALQTFLLLAWLLLFQRHTLHALLNLWRPSLAAGFAGAAASECWFLAFALATAASVRTLALVEVLFAQGVSRFLFRQKTSLREAVGIALLLAGAAMIVWSEG